MDDEVNRERGVTLVTIREEHEDEKAPSKINPFIVVGGLVVIAGVIAGIVMGIREYRRRLKEAEAREGITLNINFASDRNPGLFDRADRVVMPINAIAVVAFFNPVKVGPNGEKTVLMPSQMMTGVPNATPLIIMVYDNQCPACKAAAPEFIRAATDIVGTAGPERKIGFCSLASTDIPNTEIMSAFEVYPTYLVYNPAMRAYAVLKTVSVPNLYDTLTAVSAQLVAANAKSAITPS